MTLTRPGTERRGLGALLAVGAASAFGTLAVLGKLAYGHGLAAEQLLALRSLFAAAGLGAIATFAVGGWRSASRRVLLLSLGLGVLMAAQAYCFFLALRTLDASFVQCVLFTYPAFVALGARVAFGQRISRRTLGAIALGGIGVVLLSAGTAVRLDAALGLALLAPILFATYLLTADHTVRGAAPLAAGAVTLASAGALMATISVVNRTFALPPSTDAWAIVLVSALVPMAAVPALMMSMKRIGPPTTSLLGTCEPVVAMVLAVIVLGESASLVRVVGAACVLGTALVAWPKPLPEPR
ncbi:MAG: DMT family transporter [Actinobacteria bacterium]|nr:DMT family transporter [Actinomycetota bacterium]